MIWSDSAGTTATKMAALIGGGAICAAMVWVGLTPAPLAQKTADFQVECLVLDETKQIERTEFEGGEFAVLVLMMDIPEDVYDGQIDVKLFANVEAQGIKYRARVPQVVANVPERSERLAIDGYTPDLQRGIPFEQLDRLDEVDVYEDVKFRLPKNVPNATFTLNAVGTIKGRGSQSCEKEIHLVN